MSIYPSRWLIPTGTDLSADPDVFPFLRGQNFPVEKAPMWKTNVAEATSGREDRLKLWSYPRWHFKIAHEWIDNSSALPDLRKIAAFFNAHGGMYQGFFYNDPEDNAVGGQQIGVGDGATQTFQLVRSYGSGGIFFTEPIFGLSGTPSLFRNGTLIDPATYVLGPQGVVSFTTAPSIGAVITWTGNFFYYCRFEDDQLTLAQLLSKIWSQQGLSFKSIKP